MIKVGFSVNGKRVSVETSPTTTLLDILREGMGLTGTKEGCGKGECGACTVLMDGVPVVSCLVLASQIEGRKIMTVEGLAADKIGKALQEAFVEAGAVQCGYCIPGFVLELYALYTKNPDATDEQITGALNRHFCRCTGYEAIWQGAKNAQKLMQK